MFLSDKEHLAHLVHFKWALLNNEAWACDLAKSCWNITSYEFDKQLMKAYEESKTS